MATVVLSLLLTLFSNPTWARDDGPNAARVDEFLLEQLPPQDRILVEHLRQCGFSGPLVKIVRDPINDFTAGIYLYVDQINLSTFCQHDDYAFLKDRAFKRKLASILKEGTPLLLGLHTSSLIAWTVMNNEPLGDALRRSIPITKPHEYTMLVGRWASYHDFVQVESTLVDLHLVAEVFEANLGKSRLAHEELQDIRGLVEMARSTNVALVEMEEGDASGRIEYVPDNLLELAHFVPAPDSVAHRNEMRKRFRDRVKGFAGHVSTMLRVAGRTEPKEAKRALATIHSLIPLKTMVRLGINSEFDFDVGSVCAIELAQTIAKEQEEVEKPK